MGNAERHLDRAGHARHLNDGVTRLGSGAGPRSLQEGRPTTTRPSRAGSDGAVAPSTSKVDYELFLKVAVNVDPVGVVLSAPVLTSVSAPLNELNLVGASNPR